MDTLPSCQSSYLLNFLTFEEQVDLFRVSRQWKRAIEHNLRVRREIVARFSMNRNLRNRRKEAAIKKRTGQSVVYFAKLRRFITFLSKYCPNLLVLDLNESIDYSDLLKLAPKLECLHVKEVTNCPRSVDEAFAPFVNLKSIKTIVCDSDTQPFNSINLTRIRFESNKPILNLHLFCQENWTFLEQIKCYLPDLLELQVNFVRFEKEKFNMLRSLVNQSPKIRSFHFSSIFDTSDTNFIVDLISSMKQLRQLIIELNEKSQTLVLDQRKIPFVQCLDVKGQGLIRFTPLDVFHSIEFGSLEFQSLAMEGENHSFIFENWNRTSLILEDELTKLKDLVFFKGQEPPENFSSQLHMIPNIQTVDFVHFPRRPSHLLYEDIIDHGLRCGSLKRLAGHFEQQFVEETLLPQLKDDQQMSFIFLPSANEENKLISHSLHQLILEKIHSGAIEYVFCPRICICQAKYWPNNFFDDQKDDLGNLQLEKMVQFKLEKVIESIMEKNCHLTIYDAHSMHN